MSTSKQPQRKKKIILIAVVSVLFLLATGAGWFYYKVGPAILMMRKFVQDNKKQTAGTYSKKEVVIDTARQPIHAYVYLPVRSPRRTLLAIHGIHYDGYNEGRLRTFSEKMAQLGIALVTPDIEDLKNYRITTRALDDMEDVALWTLQQKELVPERSDGKIGLMGFSFSGGLSMSVGARASLRNRTAFIFSFGGHGDIDRTMEYLVTGNLPEGGYQEPHIYAVAVVLSRYVDRLVKAEELPLMRECLFDYLHEREQLVLAKKGPLSPEAQKLLMLCVQRKSKELGEILISYVRSSPCDPALSPTRFTPPPCRIFLLHGAIDAVIPPSESKRLYDWAAQGTSAELLISKMIVHVEWNLNYRNWREVWDLATFLTKFLRS